jgi:hypothetical protein
MLRAYVERARARRRKAHLLGEARGDRQASVQPVPCVLRLAMRRRSKRSNRPSWNRRFDDPLALEMAALHQTALAQAPRAVRRRASCRPRPSQPESHQHLGLRAVWRQQGGHHGSGVSRTALPSLSNSRWPPWRSSHRIDDQRRRARASSGGTRRCPILGAVQHARLERIGADVGQHDLDLLGDERRLDRTDAVHALGVLRRQGVIAVAAKAPMAVTALMSAWMPPPPPDQAGDDQDAAFHAAPITLQPAGSPPMICRRLRTVQIVALGHDADQRFGARLAPGCLAAQRPISCGGRSA